MPIEQRVIGGGQKIGGGKGSGAIGAKEAPAEAEKPAKKSRKKLVILLAVVVLVAGGAAAYLLLGKQGGDAEPVAEPSPVAGEVVSVDAFSLNLADGHYLRLGFDLQLTEDVGEDTPDTGKAVDAAIALFSGLTVDEVSDETQREALKQEFLTQLEELYDGEVMDVYLTNFVTQ
ncbi:MAG TPA: flagellar basal body-associated FliL family protein [Cellulomonas sp.]